MAAGRVREGEKDEITWGSLTEDDVQAAADLYTDAFTNHPIYVAFLFRSLSREERKRARHWLFVKRLQIFLETGATFVTAKNASGRLLGVVGMVPPHSTPSLWTQVRHGLLIWPYLWGWASFQAALSVDDFLGKKPADAWQIAMMAVDPSMQGRGLGSAIMRRALQAIQASGKVADVFLDTQAPVNVLFYSKLGFRVVDRRRVDPVAAKAEVVASGDDEGEKRLVEEARRLAKEDEDVATSLGASTRFGVPLDDEAPFFSWTMVRKE
jgi:ribosomal protein S18 acetylase RimI-like enzyme